MYKQKLMFQMTRRLKKLDYNNLVNTPTLNGMPLKGNVELDLNDWESSIVENSTTDKTKT